MKSNCLILKFLISLFLFSPSIWAQDTTLLNVFVDCKGCNDTYYRTHLQEVNFVRDRKVADIHILINSANLGTGTKHWELSFIPLKESENSLLKLVTDTYQIQTEIEVDQHLFKYIQTGLLPFLLERNPTTNVNLIADTNTSSDNNFDISNDPWNFWVFEISGDIDFEKETNQSEYELEGEIDLERTTEAWRYRGELSYLYRNNKITRQSTNFNSSLKRMEASGSLVKTLGEHWGAGFFGRIYSSTFTNIQRATVLQAAFEYNFFPYSQVASKEFTIAYFVGPHMYNYIEPTIYEQSQEDRLTHNITVNMNMRKAWGSAEIKLRGVQFLHDLSKNRLELESELSIRLVKGLFLRTSADFSLVRDQLFLAKGDASLEEILLERRAIATDYETGFSIGISYVFGSIYNSIVNTRL